MYFAVKALNDQGFPVATACRKLGVKRDDYYYVRKKMKAGRFAEHRPDAINPPEAGLSSDAILPASATLGATAPGGN